MKIFQCDNCSHPVYFENTYCESCGHNLGYIGDTFELHTIIDNNGNGWKTLTQGAGPYYRCANYKFGVCNWLVPHDSASGLCEACELNKTVPSFTEKKFVDRWRELEIAKHRLIYELQRFHLPLRNKTQDPDNGLAFDFLSEKFTEDDKPVRTGHFKGLITLNVKEADPVHREYMRKQMDEPYRTLIGHFRHEVGHYYWDQLIFPYPDILRDFRNLFGDETRDYGESLKRHYGQGAPANWNQFFVSEYATSHPWEDWAETWAHYLHLIDMLETAYAFGLEINPNLTNVKGMAMKATFDPYQEPDFKNILDACIPLTFAVNSINRSMGQPDLYPFVIPDPVVEKLSFIHRLLRSYNS